MKGGGSAAHLFPFYPRMRHIIPRNATALSGISLPLHRINETIASVFCQFRVGSGSVQGRFRVGAGSEHCRSRACLERRWGEGKEKVRRRYALGAPWQVLPTPWPAASRDRLCLRPAKDHPGLRPPLQRRRMSLGRC